MTYRLNEGTKLLKGMEFMPSNFTFALDFTDNELQGEYVFNITGEIRTRPQLKPAYSIFKLGIFVTDFIDDLWDA